MKRPLSRRTFLRGMGYTVGIPFLGAMLPANKSWAAAPSRFAMLYQGNGMLTGGDDNDPNNVWACKGGPAGITMLTNQLQALSNMQNYLTVVSGINCNVPQANTHYKAALAFSSGAAPADINGNIGNGTVGENEIAKLAYAGATIDRAIANRQNTPLKSLMMAVGEAAGGSPYVNDDNGGNGKRKFKTCLSWDSQTVHLDDQTLRNSYDVFRVLTGLTPIVGGNATPVPAGPSTGRLSVLDAVKPDIDKLNATLGAEDKQIMDKYLTSLASIQQSLRVPAATSPVGGSCGLAGMAAKFPQRIPNTMSNATITAQDMVDLIVLAFQCGLTNVASLMLSYDEGRAHPDQAYGNAGYQFEIHQYSHWGRQDYGDTNNLTPLQRRGVMEQYERWHVDKLARLATALKNTTDSTGSTMLDNTLILFGAGMGDPDPHRYDNMTRVLVGRGAGLSPGPMGKLVAANRQDNGQGKLLQTILAQYGISDRIGDSGGLTIPGIF